MVSRQPDPPADPGGLTAEESIGILPVPVLLVDVAGDRIVAANQAAADLGSCSPVDLTVLPLSRALVGDGDEAELRIGGRRVPVKVLRRDDWKTTQEPIALVLIDRLELALSAMDNGELRTETDRMRCQLDDFQTAQERLVSVWAHELKTPLTVVQSYLEILTTDLDEGFSEEQISFLKITYESVLRLRRLVIDLVDLIGFRSGHLSVETTTVDVASLLDEVTGEMRALAQTAELELVHERPVIRVAVRADPDRVVQIIRNLLDNAFKFTPRGGRVTVRTRVERDWVIIDVADDGVGISEGDRERIFEEFVQLKHSGVRRRQGGSGLGLAICQRIADAHGGRIELESEPDKGSVFSVRLPREHEDEID